MEVKIFQKKENRVSPYAGIGIQFGATIAMHVIGEEYAKGKDTEAEARLTDKFGEILGEDHPNKVELVKEAKKEVAQARRDGEIQCVVERICANVITVMSMAMLNRR